MEIGIEENEKYFSKLATDAAERLELVFAQFPGNTAANLIAELIDPLIDKGLVDFIIDVHASISLKRPSRARNFAC